MRFIFARHGESTANIEAVISNRSQEHGLTALGIRQAESLADRLAGEQVRGLYTSPLLRARQTSQIIVDELKIPMIIKEELREIDCGTLEGRGDPEAWETFLAIFREWLQGKKWQVHLSGGESFVDITRRFIPFFQALRVEFKDQAGSIVLISHGGLFYTMLPLILENISFKFARDTTITNTSVIVAEDLNGVLECREWCGEREFNEK